MQSLFIEYIFLILIILVLVMLANKLRLAYPIILVLGGLVLSFMKVFSNITIDPELIFFIFLPPLLYEAAWQVSWKEFWKWRRVIMSFAFPIVIITSCVVALASYAIIPGFTLALGFLLGGIISPPDAVSATTIMRQQKVPKSFLSIIEGESLLNDASSLIIFQFAIIAVTTGQFVWYNAALTFVWMVIGGICAGVAVGFIFMKVHKYLPTDANMDILLTLVTPYVMYIVAEEVNASGVLAVVSGGLFLSQYQHRFLSTSARLRGINVWQAIVFALNGIVFMLIGLDLPEITSGLGDVSLSAAIGYGLLVTAVLVVGRILSAYGAVFVTLIMRNFITVADPNPGFKGPFLLGWTGMRGVVSLAAALSIPADFPQRNLILFITFIVILTTLLLQGLTLPYFIRKIEFPRYDDYLPEEEADTELKRGMAREALQFMNENYSEEIDKHPVLQQLAMKWESNSEENIDPMMSPESKVIYLDVINKQRKWLMNKNSNAHHFDEDVIRKYLYLLDIEEEKLKFM